MSYPVKNGQTSVVLRFKLLDSSSTTGAGLTGLSSASSGLIISTIADNEASATAYTVAGSTVESITTLGTYAAPTATKCRFKELDSTNHKGVYEFQFADARFAVSSAKSLLISVLGATNLAQADFVVPLVSDDPYVAKPANYASFSIDGSGRVDVIKVAGTTQTAGDIIGDTNDIQTRLPAALTAGGFMKSDALAVNAVSTSSVTTVNANVGTTQPLNFTGTGASALVKSDMVDVAGAAVSASSAQIGVNVIQAAGTAWGSGAITAASLATDAGTEIADAVLDRDMSVGTDSGTTTVRTVRQALRFLRNKWSISGSTLTVTKEDDTTSSWTSALTTDASAVPVTASDPAG